MLCRNCKMNIADGLSFCPYCGTKVIQPKTIQTGGAAAQNAPPPRNGAVPPGHPPQNGAVPPGYPPQNGAVPPGYPPQNGAAPPGYPPRSGPGVPVNDGQGIPQKKKSLLLPILLISVCAATAVGAGAWFLFHPSNDSTEEPEDRLEDRDDRSRNRQSGSGGGLLSLFGGLGGDAEPAGEATPAAPAPDETPTTEVEPEPAPGPEPEPAPEPGPAPDPLPDEPIGPVDPSDVLLLDAHGMDNYMSSAASGATWAYAVMDVSDGTIVGSDRMYDTLSSSALLDIPILYTCAVLSDEGVISLDTNIRIERATAGRTQLANRVGRSMSVYDLLCYMLQYSDNTASNTLMGDLTFRTINETCAKHGYNSVSLNNYILSTTDYTDNDNYVSCADLCGMLRELYSDEYSSIGSLFLQQNMVIRDAAGAKGLGQTVPGSVRFMNLNGQKADKYNEVAIVDDGTDAYVIAFMGCRSTMDRMVAAAATCGEYVYGKLGIS